MAKTKEDAEADRMLSRGNLDVHWPRVHVNEVRGRAGTSSAWSSAATCQRFANTRCWSEDFLGLPCFWLCDRKLAPRSTNLAALTAPSLPKAVAWFIQSVTA